MAWKHGFVHAQSNGPLWQTLDLHAGPHFTNNIPHLADNSEDQPQNQEVASIRKEKQSMLRLSASETMIVGGGRSEHESKEKDACRVIVRCGCPPSAVDVRDGWQRWMAYFT